MQTPSQDQHFNHDKNWSKHLEQNWKVSLRELGALLFVFSIWAISQSVLAKETNSHEHYSSLWLKPVEMAESQVAEGIKTFAALQLETDVDISVAGPIARVLVKQRFHNPSQFWVEGEYVYPLPENAAVDALRMHIGDRVIEGQIKEKKEAAKVFAKARKDGKRASLLMHKRSNRFRTQVTNIAPNEEVIIAFEYQQWIDFKDGAYHLVFPMVSTPSYTPSLMEGSKAILDPEFVLPENNYREPDEAPLNPVSINVDIDSGVPIDTPVSMSHAINHQSESATEHRVFLTGKAQESNKDFILSWRPTSSAMPTVTVLKEKLEGENYGLLMIMPPQLKDQESSSIPRELIMVLDVSGSMQGESLIQAKLALLEALSRLREDDLFNIIWFNNSAYSLFSQSQLASARNLSLARNQVKGLKADGGTNMIPALDMALNKHPIVEDSASLFEPLRQVVFITDGAVSNEVELFAMIRQNLGSSRLFTVGIGSAPNSFFMRKAARAGRGTFTYVSQPQEVNEKVGGLMAKLQAPALTHIELDFQGYQLDLLPDPLPDLYIGEPLYAAFKADYFPEYLHLSARLDGEASYLNTPLNDPVLSNRRKQKGIAKEWARRKIEHLKELQGESLGDAREAIKKETTRVALEHDLVTQYTSLVSVDVSPVRGGGEMRKTNIPSNLPKGWSLATQKNRSLRLAQTSTGMWSFIYSGLISLLFGCFLWALFTASWIKEKETV